jgi:ketosteroid isomerase-like protein
MSQENVEVVRRGYEAFNRGDFDAAMEVVHPEIEFVLPGGGPRLLARERFARGWSQTPSRSKRSSHSISP